MERMNILQSYFKYQFSIKVYRTIYLVSAFILNLKIMKNNIVKKSKIIYYIVSKLFKKPLYRLSMFHVKHFKESSVYILKHFLCIYKYT